MVTMRNLIEKFGDDILDASISFRVFDGHLNCSYSQSDCFDWADYFMAKTNEGVFFRFNVVTPNHRLVRERK